jgi:DNA-binding MarR family transcriptional regulator
VTIKEQLMAAITAAADSRGRVDLTPEALGKQHGLSGHDLAKNLDQLRKEGLISVQWDGDRMTRLRLRRGKANEAALAELKPPVHRHRDNILAWITRQPAGMVGGWVELPDGWRSLTAAMGVPPDKADSVAVTASKLTVDGVLEVKREGRRISAVRRPMARREEPEEEPPPGPATANGDGQRGTSVMPDTPMLNAYLSARRIARLAPDDNPYVEVVFEELAIAEEALALREYAHKLIEERR